MVARMAGEGWTDFGKGESVIEFDGYYVHNVSVGRATEKVMYDGAEVLAELETLEIEFHPCHDATHGGGSFVARAKGKNLAAYREHCITNQTGKLVWMPDGKYLAGKEPE